MWQAYTPWPGIYTMYEGKRLLLEKVSISSHPDQSEESRNIQEQLDSSAKPQNDERRGKVLKLETGEIGIVC